MWIPKAYLASLVPARRDLTRFIVLTEGRTGSEALVRRLNSHPDIRCDGELLKVPRRSVERLLRGRVRSCEASGRMAYGFKLKGVHLSEVQGTTSPRSEIERLHRAGWRFIHLSRRNRLLQAVSALRANLTTVFHYEAGNVPPFEPVTLDPAWLLHTLRWLDGVEAENRALIEGLAPLNLVYEDDLENSDDQERTMGTVLQWLDLPTVPTSTRLVRAGLPLVRPMVANYDEVAEALVGTAWEQFLDAGDGGPGEHQPGRDGRPR